GDSVSLGNAHAQPHTPRVPLGGAKRADFPDSDERDAHPPARCGVMDCRWRTGVGVMGWLHTRTGIAAGIVWHTYSAQADASGGGATSPSAPRGGNVIHDNI